MSHTPGPWSTGQYPINDYAYAIYGVDNSKIGVVEKFDAPYKAEEEANARLIAAAPDLYIALKSLYALVEGECPSLLENDHHAMLAFNAIAKAEGKDLGS
jgi:hypothetical protein